MFNISRVQRTTNHVYYNLDIVNQETIDDENDPILAYQDVRDADILSDCSKYYFSIIRFQLNGIGKNIPVFIPSIETGQSDPNKTIYKIGMMFNYHYKGQFYTKNKVLNISFESQNKKASTPKAPTTEMDISSDYYFCFTYSHFFDLVNKTLNNLNEMLYEEIKTDLGVNDDYKLQAPRIEYNVNQYFDLYLDTKGYGRKTSNFNDTSGAVELDIKSRLFFNSNMYGLFTAFHNNYLGGDVKNVIDYYEGNSFLSTDKKTTSITGCAYEIFPVNDPLKLNEVTINTHTYHKMRQDFQTLSSLWCPVSALVFTSTLIPILPELTGAPIVFNDNGQSNATTRSNYEKIITDMILPLGSPDDYCNTITYSPSGEYRLSEFNKSKMALRTIGLNGFFKLRTTGQLIPLRMYNQSSINMKLMFRHRDYA